MKNAGRYFLKVIHNDSGCEGFSQVLIVTGGAPMAGYDSNPNVSNMPSVGKNDEMIFEGENLELFVYPNPTQNRVTIGYNIAGNNELYLKIYDLTGRLQHTEALSTNNNTLDVDVNTYPSGTYLVQLLGDKESAVRQLSVVR